MMFDPNHEKMARNMEAMQARHAESVRHGLASEPVTFSCNAAPATDSISVRRQGMPGHPLSEVVLAATGMQGGTSVILGPSDARAMAMTLLTLADEIDGLTTDFKMVASPSIDD